MNVLDQMPLSALERLRNIVVAAIPDAEGMISNDIPHPEKPDTSFRVSTNKEAYLSLIEAAIARRGASAAEADK